MIWKAVKGLVILVSLSLVCPLPSSAVRSPLPSSAVRSPLPRHKSQVSSTSHKAGQKEHHYQSTVTSASEQDNDGGQHQQFSSVGKEPALVRLKRIKRQVASLRTIQQPSSSSSNSKYVDAFARNQEKLDLRPIGLTDGRTPATPLGSFHEFGGGRVHTEMLRRLEDVNRKLSQHGGGKVRSGNRLSSKTNEIAELRKGHHHIQDGSRNRLTATGNYAHHKHEQDNLDNTAAVVAAAVRQRNRKSKHQKNRSDFSPKSTKSRNYALAPRLRPGDRIQDSETAKMPGRGSLRRHAEDKGNAATEAKHRTRRGQRSGMVSSSYKAGSHAQGVKTELERIRRMQRDLMKEISHLEHMKKKKKRRNVSERISQGQRKVSAPKRK